jgi:predicted ATPase/class 3 adenylate cyclase
MTFDEILAQIIDLLKRQGRVSYSALKRRFDLNDDYLNDLKDELLYVYPVKDDEGRGLVWTGTTESVKEVVAQPTQPTPQPAVQAQHSPQVAPLPTAPPPDAERRQLTVMFCDLVDSTRLSSQLDPEDWRDVVRAYQRACTEVIQRYDGHIAQLLGDGLLVYFGYPQAHEDDPQRAVRTGLGILAAMGDLNTRLQQAKDIQLAVRVGIHTGLVVVGAMGDGGRQEQLALGETPNVAARIQGLATPNTLVVSRATYRLIRGYFAFQDLGAQTLRGIGEPVTVYQVIGESGATSRLDVAQLRGLTPLVGRESEVTLLLERWEQVKAGHGQVVLLTGDAGIGKSRLVQMLKDHVAQEPHVRWECRSIGYYQNSVLYPMIDLFQRILRFEAHETPDAKLEKLEQALSQYRLPLEETVSLFGSLLSLPLSEERYPPLNLSPQRQRQKTLETIVAILLELAEHQPVLLIVEDLHWTDPTTLEFLGLLVEQVPTAAIYTLLTCRPHFQPSWHHRSYLSEVTVHRLSHTQVEQIVTGVTDGKTLPREVLAQIVEKTDGVPLFVEELTKAILESGSLKEVDDHYALTGSLSTLAIPATLQDSLMARLDRLMTAKVIAQLGAVIGRQFTYALLQMVSQVDEMTLQRELGRLVEAELVYQRGMPPQSTYMFKHALIQDAAYQSLLKSTRQQYHQRIAQVLEERFPETGEKQPELLAYHYTEAGLNAHAVSYWYQAGQRACERSAFVEAIAHLTTGLAVLTALPNPSEHVLEELDIQIALGAVLMLLKGHGTPEVEHAYARARALCQQLGDLQRLLPVLAGLRRYYTNSGDLQTAGEIAEQLLHIAQARQALDAQLEAHYSLGLTLFCRGFFPTAHTHLLQGRTLALSDRFRSHIMVAFGKFLDVWAWCGNILACVLWVRGYPEQALAQVQETLTCHQEALALVTRIRTLRYAGYVHQLCREVSVVHALAQSLTTLAHEQKIILDEASGRMQYGWTLAQYGQGEQGVREIQHGLVVSQNRGVEQFRPYYLALLADSYRTIGQVEDALQALTQALALVDKSGGNWYEADIHRLRGELLLQQASDNQAEAETCFAQAMAIAQNQSAKSWELRAAVSLARLQQQQGKRQEAHDLLAPVYGWFTEGFDTADLKDAKALLDELA